MKILSNDTGGMMNRRKMLQFLATSAAGCFIEASCIEPNVLSITRKEILSQRLPPALDGLRIALLADFHYRPDQDDELIHKVVRQVALEKPDLVLLAGDFVNSSPHVLPPLMEHLRQLDASHGVFGVMGNHDGWNANGNIYQKAFEQAGLSFLINQNSQLTIRGEKLAIAGTDFVWLGQPDPERTLRGIHPDTPVIAMVHEPDYFDRMLAQRDLLLQVSGHTHGGQCRVPILGYAPVSVRYGKKYNYGEFSNNHSKLFVTRGVGTTGPRIRFACPPELAILTLRAEQTV